MLGTVCRLTPVFAGVLALACNGEHRPSIPLRSGAKAIDAKTTRRFDDAVRRTTVGLHGFALMSAPPSVADRDVLRERGLTVLSRLTRYLYIVHAAPAAALDDTAVTRRVRHLSVIEPDDRVAPEIRRLDRGNADASGATVGRASRSSNDGTLELVIRFHDDVPRSDAEALLSRHTLEPRFASANRWRAAASRGQVDSLAASDLVRWIDIHQVVVTSDNDKARDAIRVGEVQGFSPLLGQPTGLTGGGIRIGVYDNGIEPAHADFRRLGPFGRGRSGGGLGTSRVVVNLPAPLDSSHATAVAGVIAGNGVRSSGTDSWEKSNGGTPYQWRGVAPAAELIDAERISDVVADAAATLRNHVTGLGMDIANHSYSFTVNGTYGSAGWLHDAMIRGDDAGDGAVIPPRLHVHSAGNYALGPESPSQPQEQRGYFSLGNQLKNALVVGNYYADSAVTARRSSLGPTHDGRIKPDVVAPGTFVRTTGYCTETDNPPFYPGPNETLQHACAGKPAAAAFPRTNFYYTEQGASIATAVVTGMLTLVLDELADNQGVNLDTKPPLSSTLRAIAIHSAVDLVAAEDWRKSEEGFPVRPTPGPDFVTGFGVVDAAAAVDIVRRRRVIEGVIAATCETRTYSLTLPEGSGDSVKVTLAWDDRPSDRDGMIAYTEPLLINDLDLVLIDPAGKRHYPWRLDQEVVDLEGEPISDDEQACGTAIEVRRKMIATTEPVFNGIAADGNADDPVPDGGIPVASRGPDHLNNVEQVVALASPGIWKVEVSGFAVESGPQPFSLIGVEGFKSLLFPPQTICRTFPDFCRAPLADLCSRYPVLCQDPLIIPMKGDTLVIRFDDRMERKVIQLSALCLALTQRQECVSDGSGRSAPERELILSSGARSLRLEAFDAQGRPLAREMSGAMAKRLRFPAGTGEVFVIVSPAADARLRMEYLVPVQLRR